MKKSECQWAANQFMTLYSYLERIDNEMGMADFRGADIAVINERLDAVSHNLDNLFKQGHLTDTQLTELRTRLQDVKGHLPAVGYLRPKEAERMTQPMRDNERLKGKLAEVMFESVAECECKGR